ncbi:MAG: flavin reductase family protein [Gammaproteobacteria bacterium]
MNSRAFDLISLGVYVIAVKGLDEENAFTAAWVTQVSFDPAMVAFSINPGHYSYRLLRAGGICTINVLSHNQMRLAAHFGRSGERDKMSLCRWERAGSGAPYMPEALAYYDCRASHFCDAGDHKLAVCEVTCAEILNPGAPLLYRETGDINGSSDLYPDPPII